MCINFQPNRVCRSVKTVHTSLFAKICKFAIRISKNHVFRTYTTPLRTFMLILRSIGLLDIEIPRKEIISTDGRTDRRTRRRTDGRTDGQTLRTTTIGRFFEKKILKNGIKLFNVEVDLQCSQIENKAACGI